ncbi:MAG: hypothetical protein ACK53Y_22435, partial [bacterium]
LQGVNVSHGEPAALGGNGGMVLDHSFGDVRHITKPKFVMVYGCGAMGGYPPGRCLSAMSQILSFALACAQNWKRSGSCDTSVQDLSQP